MGQALMPKDLLLARKDDDGNTQTLYDHLHNTAELAAGFEKRSSAFRCLVWVSGSGGVVVLVG